MRKSNQRNDSPFILSGNMKIPPSTAMLNFCPASLCPSALLGLCQLKDPEKTCYGKDEERRYRDTCIPSRMKMMDYLKRSAAWSVANDLISLNETKRKKITALRINEAGDFFSQADLEYAEMVAYYLSKHGITTYCYTARRDLDFEDCEHLVVNGSGWMCHNRFQVAYAARPAPNGAGWEVKDKHDAWIHADHICPGDCRKCSRCLVKTGQTTAVMLH